MTAVLTKTITTVEPTTAPIVITPVEETTEIPDDACYICSKERHTDCEGCEKHVCWDHTKSFSGWCHIEWLLCPICNAKKLQEQHHSE